MRESILCKAVLLILIFLLASCADRRDYAVIHPPQYDHLIGKEFSKSIYMGWRTSRIVKDQNGVREYQPLGRDDGCILIFGVRNEDDVILYWRVDSGSGTCLVRNKAFTV